MLLIIASLFHLSAMLFLLLINDLIGSIDYRKCVLECVLRMLGFTIRNTSFFNNIHSKLKYPSLI